MVGYGSLTMITSQQMNAKTRSGVTVLTVACSFLKYGVNDARLERSHTGDNFTKLEAKAIIEQFCAMNNVECSGYGEEENDK